MSAPFQNYVPPGLVAARFLASDARVRGIMGPVGSGKTGACLMEMLYRGMRQAPHPVDRVRRTKFAVVRDTYRQLEKTTIPSWNRWVGKKLGQWSGGSGGVPATHTVEFDAPDGTIVNLVVEFIGLGDNAVDKVMPGWEGTGAYLNEADKLSEDVLTYLRGRIGRYPAVDAAAGFAGATWRGIWLDFNAPDTEHWLYEKFVENPPAGYQFFQQPGGLIPTAGGYVVNPRAENLRNLIPGYYDEQIEGQPKWYIRRMVLNQWGASRDGEPVYEEYNDDIHCSLDDLEPIPGLPLVIGADAGLTPAVVILQRMPNGQWRVLDELVAPPKGMGAKRFGEELKRLLEERYAPWVKAYQIWKAERRPGDPAPIAAWGDPAANARASTDETTWLQVMSATTGIHFRPAPSNHLTIRLEAVRQPLTRLIDGQPAFLLSRCCKILRKGFNSGYRLTRVQIVGVNRFSDEPQKNEFSHVHDGLQYGMLGGGEHLAVLGRQQTAAQARLQTRAIDDDSPTGEWHGADGRQDYAHG